MADYPYPPRWSDRPRSKTPAASKKPAVPKKTAAPEQPPMARRRRVSPARQQAAVRRARRVTLLTLISALSIELIAAVFTSPLLTVKQVQWEAAGRLPAAEASIVSRSASIAPNINWLLAPLGRTEKTLASLPFVRSAQVNRHFPNGMEARIQVRMPLLIAHIGNRRYEIDSDGVPIRFARPETGKLPLVTLQRSYEVKPGIPLADATLRALLERVQATDGALWQRIAKIEVDQSDNLCLNMQDGIRVKLGNTDDLVRKFELVETIYARDPGISTRMASINLSSPDWPACTLRTPLPETKNEPAEL